MTSKGALQIIKESKGESFCEAYKKPLKAIEKDLDKLARFKEIEDELGIDLIILFKALKNGFYYYAINSGEPNTIMFADPENESCSVEYYNKGNYGIAWAGVDVAYIEDYGKTWSLTREELL